MLSCVWGVYCLGPSWNHCPEAKNSVGQRDVEKDQQNSKKQNSKTNKQKNLLYSLTCLNSTSKFKMIFFPLMLLLQPFIWNSSLEMKFADDVDGMYFKLNTWGWLGL